jgi:hypothetical protein
MDVQCWHNCWYPRTPKILRTSLTVDRVCGQSWSALVFFGSGLSLLPSTIIPKYVMLDCSNMHLDGWRKYDSALSRLSTSWTICQCLS